jgi:hypothetical protein
VKTLLNLLSGLALVALFILNPIAGVAAWWLLDDDDDD